MSFHFISTSPADKVDSLENGKSLNVEDLSPGVLTMALQECTEEIYRYKRRKTCEENRTRLRHFAQTLEFLHSSHPLPLLIVIVPVPS
jgi:hypothetical protein